MMPCNTHRISRNPKAAVENLGRAHPTRDPRGDEVPAKGQEKPPLQPEAHDGKDHGRKEGSRRPEYRQALPAPGLPEDSGGEEAARTPKKLKW